MAVIIGIDPHKASHAVVTIDGDEQPVARLLLTRSGCSDVVGARGDLCAVGAVDVPLAVLVAVGGVAAGLVEVVA